MRDSWVLIAAVRVAAAAVADPGALASTSDSGRVNISICSRRTLRVRFAAGPTWERSHDCLEEVKATYALPRALLKLLCKELNLSYQTIGSMLPQLSRGTSGI